ncbi:phage tail assembly protein [Pseudoxanthomonas winnipegensis]|uniref:Phage tail assembly protein n=1 Tax=Pseudoxanthomonas winnipegensis TaxID=2480810 RepID=A0A4Q8LCJ2_9GAMM|nr:phage tail assembly protein [Pseudoxanthomonas winnipegensis]TAA26563.1 phage tail assembly protein [Pseudoxanthomonas winnipegensis]
MAEQVAHPTLSRRDPVSQEQNTARKTVHVQLDTPIVRGEQSITALTLRKPASGELRGLKLVDLINMDVTALITLLPRISSPTLTAADAAAMDLPDLTQCAIEVASFFVTRAQLETLESPPA